MTVFAVADGLNHEREASLCFGKCLVGVLRRRGHAVIETDVNADLISWLLRDEGPVIIPVLHGEFGEDSALREVLWMLWMPFVGSDDASSRCTFDKSVATRLVGAAGLATPRQVVLPDDVFRELGVQAMVPVFGERIGFLLMVKLAWPGSALGAARVDSADGLPTALVGAFAYEKDVVVEEFVRGTEPPVTVLEDGTGPRALSPTEIRPTPGVCDYESRYTAGATRFLIPDELPDDVPETAGDLAVRAHRVLGHRDISHTDMTVHEDVPVFPESNVAPSLMDTSLTPLALEAAGPDMKRVFSVLVKRARHRGH